MACLSGYEIVMRSYCSIEPSLAAASESHRNAKRQSLLLKPVAVRDRILPIVWWLDAGGDSQMLVE
jgi:hypothetical protein